MDNKDVSSNNLIIKVFQGTLIGLGAVLPGISGGVLCVVFGIYKQVMELLADPVGKFKTHVPKLIPVIVGAVIGFLGIANLLSVLLEKYPAPSICVFVGLIFGMLPSLYKEAGKQGRDYKSFISLIVSMIVIFCLLIGLKVLSITITPSFLWYIFCGFCLALSIIAPGMSFSTLLMPLGLYEPFVAGIGHIDFSVLIPGGIGGFITIILLSKIINNLFNKYYSITFHGIIGIVIAATIMIIPLDSFFVSAVDFCFNLSWLLCGVLFAMYIDEFNSGKME